MSLWAHNCCLGQKLALSLTVLAVIVRGPPEHLPNLRVVESINTRHHVVNLGAVPSRPSGFTLDFIIIPFAVKLFFPFASFAAFAVKLYRHCVTSSLRHFVTASPRPTWCGCRHP